MTPDTGQILETAGVVAALLDNVVSCLTLYLSAVSGYLIVSYLLGAKLTKVQCLIITSLFIVFGLLVSYAAISLQAAVHHYSTIYGAGRTSPWMARAMGGVLVAGLLASLKFMWDIRHPGERKDN